MAAPISIRVVGDAAYRRALNELSPRLNAKITGDALEAIGIETANIAKFSKIKRGGRGRPLPRRLTSRSGIGRDSIRVNRTGLPRQVDVGSDLKYMAVHEKGGVFQIKASSVKAHDRTVLFGRRVKPFTVPRHDRKAHTARFPRRAWLEPSVDQILKRRAQDIAIESWERVIRGGS